MQPQPPLPPQIPGRPQPLQYLTPGVVCPHCQSPHSKRAGFTWWGGVLGPKILSHVKCLTCGTGYNGKTGLYNTTGIIIYTAVGAALGIVIALVALYLLVFMRT